MKALILILVFSASILGLRAAETDGLFVLGDERKIPTPELKDGEFIYRFKAVRLQLKRVVFRFDTEDKTQCWLEIDIEKTGVPRIPDPGDFYLFRIDGKDYGGFSLRGEIKNGGWRWALCMTDLAAGRILLAKIGKTYDLPESQILDQTK